MLSSGSSSEDDARARARARRRRRRHATGTTALDPNTPLNQVPMIFAHDAATGYMGDNHIYREPQTDQDVVIAWTKTQIGNLTTQLNCGARAFDMRPYLSATQGLIAQHGGVLVEYPFHNMIQEMVDWAAQHPSELLIVQIFDCRGDTFDLKVECNVRTAQVFDELGVNYFYMDQCPAAMVGMTLGQAKEFAQHKSGGTIMGIWSQCVVMNYNPTDACHGYEYESHGVSRKYSCWQGGRNQDYAFDQLFHHLDTVVAQGGPSNGTLWQTQAIWKTGPLSLALGSDAGSSLLVDSLYSRLNRRLFENLTIGRWGTTSPGTTNHSVINLFTMDNVCDQGPNIFMVFNGSSVNYTDFPDPIVLNITTTADQILNDELVLFPDNPDYRGPVFTDNVAIRRFHHRNNRWGKPNDIVQFIRNSNKDKQNDYLVGILATSMLLFGIFCLWAILMLYFKWTNKLGWLAGVPPDTKSLKNERPTEERLDTEEQSEKDTTPQQQQQGRIKQWFHVYKWKQNVENQTHDPVSQVDDDEDPEQRMQRRLKRIRIVSLVCGVSILILSGLLIGLGFKNLADAVDAANQQLPTIRYIFERVHAKSNQFLIQYNQSQMARIRWINSLVNYCNITANSTGDLGLEGINVTKQLIALNDTLNKGTIGDILSAVSRSSKDVANMISSVENTSHKLSYEVLLPMACAFVIVVDLIIVVFMVGIVLAWKKRQPRLYKDCTTKAAVPIFLVCLLVMYIVSVLALAGATLAADFCIGTPDNQIIRLLDVPQPFREYIEYYVRGCDPSLKPEFMLDLFRLLQAIILGIRDLLNDMANLDPDELPCTNKTAVMNDILEMQLEYKDVVNLIYEVGQGLRCDKINQVYAGLAYKTGCVNGFDAMDDIFAYLFAIAVLSMVIITIRVAWYQVDDEADLIEKQDQQDGFQEESMEPLEQHSSMVQTADRPTLEEGPANDVDQSSSTSLHDDAAPGQPTEQLLIE